MPDLLAVLEHQQWSVIRRAIERYSSGEISELVALGLIANGFLTLDAARQSVLTPPPHNTDEGQR